MTETSWVGPAIVTVTDMKLTPSVIALSKLASKSMSLRPLFQHILYMAMHTTRACGALANSVESYIKETNGFSSTNLVGTGSFRSVYKGTLPHLERPIAVNMLNLQTRGASKSFFITESSGKIQALESSQYTNYSFEC